MSQPPPSPEQMLYIAAGAMRAGNLAFAEILCRMILDGRPDDRSAPLMIAQIAQRLGIDRLPSAQAGRDKFLLIKAWGFGFWSDMDHVLGGLLLAEITGRVPVVHWGRNSLFSDDPARNAFEEFFEPVSALQIDDLIRDDFTYFPPKWSAKTLHDEDVNKWQGPHSRVAGIYLLNRPEMVIVADYYLPIIGLAPWIPAGHAMHGKSVEQIYHELFSRRLKPRRAVQDRIDAFHAKHLAGAPFIAAHVRGSDKRSELADLEQINSSYFEHIDEMAPDSNWRIFLLTDAQPTIAAFRARYGDRVVLTDAERTADQVGLHYKPGSQRSRRGVEVMVDTYVAARANRFIGNGASNVSCMVEHLKEWDPQDFRLLVPSIHHQRDPFLHQE
jgi:hypothetical protein